MAHAGTTPAADSSAEFCSIRIEMPGTDPLIWREVDVPTSVTLKVLHDIVQIVMGWQDYHLWEFTIGKKRYGPTADGDWGTAPRAVAATVRLRDVLKPGRTTIDYMYDFGDGWEHRLVAMRIRPGEPGLSYPRYVGGEWAAPPEDSGGLPGFYAKLDALADPNDPDHVEIKDWLGDYDPKEIDVLPIKYTLARIAKHRRAGRVRSAPKA